MKKNLLTLALIFILSMTIRGAVAQTTYDPSMPPILPKTPNSAILERFGNYEVSMFTGLPDISIPLYTIKTAGFEVPINLVYHASGLRVTDFPSWVGLGWAIDAGGQVSRTLNGRPDEVLFGFLSGVTRETFTINRLSQGDVDYLWGLNNGSTDSGSDIFSYSFPGGGGKFFFSRIDSLHYQPVLIPYAPVNISFNHSGQQISFNIKDVQGNKYQYGTTATEFSANSFYGSSQPSPTPLLQTSAWMMEKMISANKNDTINFAYQTLTDNTPTERVDTWEVDDMVNNTDPEGSLPGTYTPTSGAAQPNLSSTETYSELPQQISFKNGKVIFTPEATARQDFNQSGNSSALKSIQVYSTSTAGNVLLKTITFFYGYFISGTDATTKRMRLDSIEVSDANSSVINSYRFTYNTSVNLPEYNSMSKDYWGYFNGQTNTSTVPQQTLQYQPFPTSTPSAVTIGTTNAMGRLPDSVYMQADMLTQIGYPTGGYTVFQYATNKYLDTTTNSIMQAGGLRVTSISSYDGISATPIVNTYQYGTSGLGRPNFFYNRYYFNNQVNYQHQIKWTDPATQTVYYYWCYKRQRVYYSNPTINVQPFDGAPVVYPFVTEYRTYGSNVLGKTEYRYRDSADVVESITGAPYVRNLISSLFYERGQLKDKKTYKTTSAGQYQPVEEETNTYNVANFASSRYFEGLMLAQLTNRSFWNSLPNVNNGQYTTTTSSTDWAFNDYVLSSDDNYLTSTTKKTYDANDSTQTVSSTTQIAYTDIIHQQPTQVTTVDSKNETLVTNSRYAADYIPTGGTVTGVAVLDTMVARNMQNDIVERWSTLQKPSQSAVTTGGTVNTYQQTSNLVLPLQNERLKVTAPLTNYVPASIVSGALQTDSRYEPLLNFNLYDSYGNLAEVQQVSGPEVVYLWGYGREYPVAKIVGSNYSSVYAIVTQAQVDAATATANNDVAVRTLLNNLRTGLPNAQVTTITYIPKVGMSSETDAKGEITFYEYDSFQRLMNIKDTNGNITKHYDYHYYGY